ncbi:Pentatricopeptide repeat-containing protein [Vitis vinifera]|uniref:Pentatricopeptide repeat-containing protein n=1 Tax=Vitis vinifera TaxID=29760 RepID=A0A438KCH7_VITVI|nr:Pentatricopeptide repeat-containing protein [Vitis vinifera]
MTKEAGCSWLQIKSKIHTFVAGGSNEFRNSVEYKKVWKRLMEAMEEVGYVPDTGVVLHDVSEEMRAMWVCGHSERLATMFALINTASGMPIRITKNLRVCVDCHSWVKTLSKVTGRVIVLRDTNRFHHFKDGIILWEDGCFIAFSPSDLIPDINGGALGSTVLLVHLHLLTLIYYSSNVHFSHPNQHCVQDFPGNLDGDTVGNPFASKPPSLVDRAVSSFRISQMRGNVDVWLATMFALINTASGMPIRITKNLHVCVDCHSWVKIVSKVTRREIVLRDTNRFHHFKDGVCTYALQCSALDGPVSGSDYHFSSSFRSCSAM